MKPMILSMLIIAASAAAAQADTVVVSPSTAPLAGDPERVTNADRWSFTASLIDPERNAASRRATVQVRTTGIRIVDPAASAGAPVPGEAHYQYQLDDQPPVSTSSDRLSFENLTSGDHRIAVRLAGSDGRPLGPEQTFAIRVP